MYIYIYTFIYITYMCIFFATLRTLFIYYPFQLGIERNVSDLLFQEKVFDSAVQLTFIFYICML